MKEPLLVLEEAIVSAVNQLDLISRYKPNERLPKEAVIQSELYRHFTNQGYVAHPEAGYFPAEKGEKISCDLRIIHPEEKQPELWIEIKMARYASGFNTKNDEEKNKWESDGWKLDYVNQDAHRAFLLIVLSERDPDTVKNNRFFLSIRNLWGAEYPVKMVCKQKIEWRQSSISFVSAWLWTW